MVDIINLRIARKRQLRSKKEQQASENRTKFGTSSHLRKIDKANSAKAGARHKNHQLETAKKITANDNDDA